MVLWKVDATNKGVEVTWETNVSVGTRISAYRTSIISKKLVLLLTVNKRGINDVLIALYSIYIDSLPTYAVTYCFKFSCIGR